HILGGRGASFQGIYDSLDSFYDMTAVGEFASGPGPYGTFDRLGNVWEWIETPAGSRAVRRGGSFHGQDAREVAAYVRDPYVPKTHEDCLTGFRVARCAESDALAAHR
ncbi:SUMF1/EgtB/PvdO family nonheme iron enzyme, partial [Escherichia coli]